MFFFINRPVPFCIVVFMKFFDGPKSLWPYWSRCITKPISVKVIMDFSIEEKLFVLLNGFRSGVLCLIEFLKRCKVMLSKVYC